MKFLFSSIKHKITSGYSPTDESMYQAKSTNINILLNRVKVNQKLESRNKIIFSASALIGLLLFGIIIF